MAGCRPLLGGTIWAAATSLALVVLALAIVGVGALFGVGYLTNVMLPLGAASIIAFSLRMTYVLRGGCSSGGPWARCGIGFDPRLPVAFRDFVPLIFFMGFMMLNDVRGLRRGGGLRSRAPAVSRRWSAG